MSDIAAVCERLWPADWAQAWDSVGLAVGDPQAPIESMLLALDPVDEVVEEACEGGYGFLFTHHPLMLRGVTSVAADTLKGGAVHRLISSGVAAFNAHTNADSAVGGVSDVLADVLGMGAREPLEAVPGAPAGVGLGRVGDLGQPRTVVELAQTLAKELAPTATGIRIAGDPEATVHRAAVLGGAGDSLFAEVRAAGAQVYVTSDLRHHPAAEARDESHRTDGSPALVDTSHWAAESLWLPHAAEQLRTALAEDGFEVAMTVSELRADPWNMRIDQPDFRK